MRILNYIKLAIHKCKWRMNNRHNQTIAVSIFPCKNVNVGKNTYGPLELIWFPNAMDAKVKIGCYCSIGLSVKFLVGGGHNYHRISTWPFQTMVYKQKGNMDMNQDIIIEDDVWIGFDSLILPGTRIGRGTVIGARSIVTKDIEPYSVYVGTKVIKKRFPDEIIDRIMGVNFAGIEHCKDDAYKDMCQKELTIDNVDNILEVF